jgi:hypothetical protein
MTESDQTARNINNLYLYIKEEVVYYINIMSVYFFKINAHFYFIKLIKILLKNRNKLPTTLI